MANLEFYFNHHASLGSTNDEAIRLARNGEKEGAVITADFQAKGRGREERVWQSSKGKDLLISFLLRPHLPINQTPGITLMAAGAVQDALDHFKINSEIKKPNDVLVYGKKIAGILTETQSQGEETLWCVVGVGLNVNSEGGDIPNEAISMHMILGKDVPLDEVKNQLTESFKNRYQNYLGYSE